MDILSAIVACSLHSDEQLVRAIVESASRGNPYAVVDPEEVEDPATLEMPKTLEDAIARSERIASSGTTPLLGLMQVPPGWAEAFGRPARALFDPCVNVSVATAMLSAFENECRQKAARGKGKVVAIAVRYRACTLRKYGERIGMPDFSMMTELELRSQRGAAGDLSKAPILYIGGTEQTWGADQIMFEMATEVAASTPRKR